MNYLRYMQFDYVFKDRKFCRAQFIKVKKEQEGKVGQKGLHSVLP